MKKLALLMLLCLPPMGLWLEGRLAPQEVAQYLQFPPLTRYVPHAPFSWFAFTLLALFIVLVLAPFVRAMLRGGGEIHEPGLKPRPYPWWGWLGVLVIVAAWIVAWTRVSAFAPLQAFTFSPLWVGYIMVVNALTWRRSGHCMLLDRPGTLAKLAFLSAAFWWYFEYLNRFVQNWYYVGVDGFSPLQYVLFATLPFATVLPAVLGTYEWLDTFPRLRAGLTGFRPWQPLHPRRAAGFCLIIFGLALAGIGVWPDYLFPMLWISPLAVFTCMQVLRGRPTVFAGIRTGDWRRVILLALAALICGFFWEMWNYWSVAKWIYAVPFVNSFHIFEMPLLGFAGYLPFGLECAVVADEFLGSDLWVAPDPTLMKHSPG